MIAVIGATGTIGRDLLPLLTAADPEVDAARLPSRVRALTRNLRSPHDGPGIEWVEADLQDRPALPRALEGVERLFLLTGNAESMVRLQKNAVKAAVEAGVRRVVKLSALGATDHSRSVIGLWHFNVERALRESGLEWTILRPHHFMQNLLDPVVFDREAGRVHSASGEGRIPFIDTRDIAAVAAAVLTEDGHEGEIYTLTGPEARSYRDATELLSKTLGRRLTYVPETPDEAWSRRRAHGQPAWLAAAQVAIAEYQRAGGLTEATTETVGELTGRTPRTLRDFVEDHAEALAGG